MSPPSLDTWRSWRDALEGASLPAGVVDLDALDHNIDLVGAALAGSHCTLRPATKSVRCVALLRHIQARLGDRARGWLAFTADEVVHLLNEGFDDIVLAYPSVRSGPLRRVARAVREGATVALMADCAAHLQAYAAAAQAEDTVVDVVLELDLSYRPLGGRVHLGARRSPIRTVAGAVAFASTVRATPGLRLRGLMGYEAHVASTRETAPGAAFQAPFIRGLKNRVMVPALRALRHDVVAALRADGHALPLVNGGGTGSLHTTAAEPACTEVTAGSGFLCSHLFTGFDGLALRPAVFFALEVVRTSDPGHVTTLGGGIVASGSPGPDRLPLPWLPPGLRLTSLEGAGEVQTPLTGAHTAVLSPGDPVFFRPAKAGEPAERLSHYLLLRGGAVVDRVPTYRGQGCCFL